MRDRGDVTPDYLLKDSMSSTFGAGVRLAQGNQNHRAISAMIKNKASLSSFMALDTETASADPSSICQIGLAKFEAGLLVSSHAYNVRPLSRFAANHTALHGLTAHAVQRAPTWREIYPEIRRQLLGQSIVSHTLFDRNAVFKACSRSRDVMFSYVRWLDTYKIARGVWPHLESYALAALARHLGLEYRPHDAGEDARIAGLVFLRAQTIQNNSR